MERPARPRVTHLDRDRALVEAARGDPARVRRPLSTVPGPGVQLRVLRARRSSRSRGRHRANVPRRPREPRPVRGACPAGRRRRRVDVPRLALPDRPQRRRQPAAGASSPSTGARSRPPRIVADPLDVERGAAIRDEAAAAWRAVGRLPADRRRAIVLRFVEEMSTAEIAGVLGESEGAVRVLIHRALRTVARDLDVAAAAERRPVIGHDRFERDGTEVEALLTDLYLERVLARAGTDLGPADADLDPASPPRLRPASPRPDPRPPLVPLRGAPRGAARRGGRGPRHAGRGRRRGRRRSRCVASGRRVPATPSIRSRSTTRATSGARVPRPLLIGGALTSAAMSLAGRGLSSPGAGSPRTCRRARWSAQLEPPALRA